MIRLNLGCGRDIKPKSNGWINLDILSRKEIERKIGIIEKIKNIKINCFEWDFIIYNLNKAKLPFQNNSIEEIYLKNILQYKKISLLDLMKDFHRVCKNNSIITIIVPHENNRLQEPDTITNWNIHIFDKYIGKDRTNYRNYPQFEIVEIREVAFNYSKYIPFKKIISRFLNNLFYEIEYKLKVIK